jgi:GntR family histidine utilization transcriptional repressor
MTPPHRTALKPNSRKPHDRSIPIHAEIQRDIEDKIMRGEWQPGDRVPNEQDLAKTYNCSRMTVNKALSNLSAAGLLIRKRRSGSFVAMPRFEEPLLAIQDIRAEVLSTDRSYNFEIMYRTIRTVAEATDAGHLGVPLLTRMLCIDVMHYADGLPFALEARQINLHVLPEADKETFEKMPPGSWLLANVPWSEGEHSLRAISADEVLARQLKISIGTACFSMARRTWRNGELITFVRLVYPGERHRFVVRFGPGGPSAGLLNLAK